MLVDGIENSFIQEENLMNKHPNSTARENSVSTRIILEPQLPKTFRSNKNII